MFIITLFFLTSLLVSAQATGGVRVTELAIPTYQQEEVLGVYNNTTETFVVLKKDNNGGGRILYKKNSEAFRDVDISSLSGSLYILMPVSTEEKIVTIPTTFLNNPDGLYFSTFPSPTISPGCGSSYRIKNGKVEVLGIVGQEIDLQLYDGRKIRARINCPGIANQSGDSQTDVLLQLYAIQPPNTSWSGFVRKSGGLYTILLPTFSEPQPSQYPHPYALGHGNQWGVWGDSNVIRFVRTDNQSFYRLSQFDLKTKIITNLYDITTINGSATKSIHLGSDPVSGDRLVRATTSDGNRVYVYPTQKDKIDVLFDVPSQIQEFGPVNLSVSGSFSKKMPILGVISDRVSYLFKAVAIWDGSTSRVVMKEGQPLSSGKVVKSLNKRKWGFDFNWSSAQCTAVVPTYPEEGVPKLDALLEIKMPCILEYPEVSTEGSMVTLRGLDFTLGSEKVDVKVGSSESVPAVGVTSTQLSFMVPSSCTDPCEIQVVSGPYASNVVKLKINRAPVPEPQVLALTDLNGVASVTVSPGKLMTLYGTEFCSFRTLIPLIPPNFSVANGLPTYLPAGCRVLIDGNPVGLYFAWTGIHGQSQINFLVPYGISSGSHELSVQRVENRNGALETVATSRVFRFEVGDVNPTFFKPHTYPISLQNAVGNFISGEEPAKPGEVLVAYLSGGGRTSPMLTERMAGVASFTGSIKVWVNEVPCVVHYAGTQGQYPGLEQINFQIPESARPDDSGLVTLKIQVGSAPAQEFQINLN